METVPKKTPAKTKLLTGLFNDRDSVESAYQSTINRGYKPEDINFVMSDKTREKYFANEYEHAKTKTMVHGDKSMEGLALGGVLGSSIVGFASAIAAIGTALVVPGLGLVIAGPLAAGLAGAGVGGFAGGIAGALIGWGIPEDRVKEYEKGIQDGGILMAVNPRSEQDSTVLSSDWNKFHSKNTQFK